MAEDETVTVSIICLRTLGFFKYGFVSSNDFLDIVYYNIRQVQIILISKKDGPYYADHPEAHVNRWREHPGHIAGFNRLV